MKHTQLLKVLLIEVTFHLYTRCSKCGAEIEAYYPTDVEKKALGTGWVYVSHNTYDYIYKKQEQEEEKNMIGFIVGLILGGIIGFVGCSVLVIARDDTRRKK